MVGIVIEKKQNTIYKIYNAVYKIYNAMVTPCLSHAEVRTFKFIDI